MGQGTCRPMILLLLLLGLFDFRRGRQSRSFLDKFSSFWNAVIEERQPRYLVG